MKTAILVLVGLIAVAFIGGMFVTQKLYTEIHIQATPKVVWDHLVDIEKYPEWNPFIKKISGDVSEGRHCHIVLGMALRSDEES